MYKYEQHGWEIVASGIPVNVSVERNGDTFVLESDGPILIRAPFLKGKKSAELQVYENDILISSRKGQVSRANPEQLVFRLEKAYRKVVIAY